IRDICLTALGVSSAVILPAIVYDSIKFGHRLAGPIVKVKKLLPKIGVEKINPNNLRTHDYWKDLPVEFNDMLERDEAWRQQVQRNAQDSEQVKAPHEPEACAL